VLGVADALPAEFQNMFRPRDRSRLVRVVLDDPQPFAVSQKVRVSGCAPWPVLGALIGPNLLVTFCKAANGMIGVITGRARRPSTGWMTIWRSSMLQHFAADLTDLDVERLEALDCYDLLDTPPEPQFDRVVRLIKDIFNVPMAIVSAIDGHRQWYKASEGLAAREVPVRDTFCRHTILDTRALVVPDATKDSRFAGNPSVTAEPHIRFFAGMPLTTPEGHNIGTICAIDTQPRQFDERQRRILRRLPKWSCMSSSSGAASTSTC
jgi:hypothetical protein